MACTFSDWIRGVLASIGCCWLCRGDRGLTCSNTTPGFSSAVSCDILPIVLACLADLRSCGPITCNMYRFQGSVDAKFC